MNDKASIKRLRSDMQSCIDRQGGMLIDAAKEIVQLREALAKARKDALEEAAMLCAASSGNSLIPTVTVYERAARDFAQAIRALKDKQ